MTKRLAGSAPDHGKQRRAGLLSGDGSAASYQPGGTRPPRTKGNEMKRKQRVVAIILAVAALTLSLTACGSGAVGQLGELHDIAKSCPKGKTTAAFVALAGNASQRVPQLTVARMDAVQSLAKTVAVCGGGQFKVVAFGPSLASSVTVYDDSIHPDGATTNARLLQVPKLVEGAMAEIQQGLPQAFKQLSRNGTDPLGQLQAARDFIDEQGPDAQTEILIETAGMAPQVNTRTLTPQTAIRLADRVNVPDLHEARLTVAGLGRVGSGRHPSTITVEGLVSFYNSVCHRTGALACLATSDITVGG